MVTGTPPGHHQPRPDTISRSLTTSDLIHNWALTGPGSSVCVIIDKMITDQLQPALDHTSLGIFTLGQQILRQSVHECWAGWQVSVLSSSASVASSGPVRPHRTI